ncbi:blood vessel epicardial substance isoform X2 [Toxorhynchites rutilus septentrionalis]|uniref:blood vessel epicardial substance isoform X2 n=1 Tax=Toxorhynchites rutilus septentrionalis TaxID=329112 RepID=UPI00247A46D8|nr:blood vessel epicardial substance isoform X2 [Toxorhynchites rutilus septentrionalis]
MILLGLLLALGLVETTSPLSVAQQQHQQHQQHHPQQQQGHFPSKIGSPDGLIIEDSPIAPSSQYIVQKDVWNGASSSSSSNHHNHLHNQYPSSPSGSSISSGSDVPHRSRLVPDSNDTFHSLVPGVVGGANGGAVGAAEGGGGGNIGFGGFFDGSEWALKECFSLRRTHHLYYQIGNGLFFLAFLAPNAPFGMLWLRCLVIAGCVLMIVWGWQVECTLDAVIWASLFLVFNAIYVGALLCKLRPVRFEKEIEAVYVALFKPLRVSRHQFKKVLNCMKLVRSLKYQEIYAQEKVTKVDSLSLVLSGKLVVSQNQKALHIVFPHQFLDSPEWFGVSTDDYFQVSIMAMEESRVLIWHRDKLKLSIMAEPFLQAVFDHILGRDVVKKLMQVTQVSETMAQSNGYISSGYGDDAEDKPMLVMKNNKSSDSSGGGGGGGHGITALINRQLQALPRISKYYYCAADPNAWRLGRIDEGDHETAV